MNGPRVTLMLGIEADGRVHNCAVMAGGCPPAELVKEAQKVDHDFGLEGELAKLFEAELAKHPYPEDPTKGRGLDLNFGVGRLFLVDRVVMDKSPEE